MRELRASACLGMVASCYAHGVGRPVPLPDGKKYPPPRGSTGSGKEPPSSDAWGMWFNASIAALDRPRGRVAVVLSPGYLAFDIDTAKLADHEWERLRSPIVSALADAGAATPHNTTRPGYRRHGHYIFRAPAPSPATGRATGRLIVGGCHVGDLIRPDHRYLATGSGYLARWREVPPLTGTLARWIERKRPPSTGRRRRRAVDAGPVTMRDIERRVRARAVGEGGRNAELCRLVGALKSIAEGGDIDHGDIEALALDLNRSWFRPPLSDAEVRRTVAALQR